MSATDPTATASLRALVVAKQAPASASLAGVPLAIAGVWLINTYIVPDKVPVEVAVAAGTIIDSVVKTIWSITSQLLHKVGIET